MKVKQICAIVALAVIALLIILLLVLAFTGAEPRYILADLFCLMVVPALFYIYRWYAGIWRKEAEKHQEDR